jgi:hypothetical protein
MEKLAKAEVKNLTKGLPITGIVEVRLVDPKRTGTITVRGFNQIDDFGNHTWRPFVDSNGSERIEKITKKRILRLTIENDRLLYGQLVHHPHYVNSPSSVIRLVNLEEGAVDFISKREFKNKAETIISKSSDKELISLVRVLKINIKPNSSFNVIKRELYEHIDNYDSTKRKSNAELLLEEYNSPDYPIKVLLRNAIAQKTVIDSLNRMMFGSVNMGTTFDVAATFLKNNKDIANELEKAVD